MYSFPQSSVFYRDLRRNYVRADRARGMWIYDDSGERYLDACGGALVVNLGHGRSELAKTAARQAEELDFVHGSQFTTRAMEGMAARLCEQLPSGLDKIYLVPGGAEATETAIKLAVQYFRARGEERRTVILSASPGYHGNTLGALQVSARPTLRVPYLDLLHGGASAVESFAPGAFCFHCPLDKRFPSCDLACAHQLDSLVDSVGAERVAAFVVEPIIGASACIAPSPPGYLAQIQDICRRRGILLIVDEILTGFGRTGSFSAWQSNPELEPPDMVLLGKGLTNGVVPGGALAVGTPIVKTIEESLGAFTHGFTFSHHPVVASVSERVLQILADEGLVERVAQMESHFFERLQELQRFSFIGDIRGRGFLAGIEFSQERDDKPIPFDRSGGFAERFTRRAFTKHLLVYPSTAFNGRGNGDGVILAPAFTMTESELDFLMKRLIDVSQEIEDEKASHS